MEPGEPVFLDIEGGLVPFFLTSVEERDPRTVVISLDDIDSEEKARRLSGIAVYLPGTRPGGNGMNETDLSSLVGYEVFTPQEQSLGLVKEAEELPMHWVLRLRSPEGERLIPLHEDLIVEIDPGRKRIVMDLPNGLTEI
ncbi:MAG TPA: hypothetical protein ENF21_00860 [Bacteroidetes bacterium]|nr:hypothetical protein [Bacteroidota bacterium]